MKTEKNLKDYKFNENSFKFANAGEKLFDQKFETKPTSFAKDSFRRFCKNKSSVVAAIILGIIILLAIFVPVFSPYSTTTVSAAENKLPPKLFAAGTGFWDGTTTYRKTTSLDGSTSGILYDSQKGGPAGNFILSAVMDLVVDEEPSFTNAASTYATGGFVMFENQVGTEEGTINTLTSDTFEATSDGDFAVEVVFGTEDDALGSKLGEYRIVFSNSDAEVVLQDWSTEYADVTLDISTALSEAGVDSLTGSVVFQLKPLDGLRSYILLKSVVVSSANEANAADLAKIGFTDANEMVLRTIVNGVRPRGYWQCTGRKGLYKASVYFCEFVYDNYEATYGNSEVVMAASEFQKLIDQGLCTYDASIGPESFVELDESCPVDAVVSQETNRVTGKLLSLTVVTYKYTTMGYSKMPAFIFGTDDSGNDVFTKMFAGLRTSLMLGVFTFAFCFTFGLIWGSISGYFGGVVDLAMERFCDILGGVPWIVVMTLCILLIGNNFVTFFLALCLTGWMGTAARTRTQFYRFKHMEYVLASRTLGSNHLRLIFKHILPNSLGTIVTSSVLMIPSVIFSEATLAYLNLGLQGVASFGVMLSENQKFISSNPYLIVIPSVVMALLMISFNLFGNGLRDAINPTLKGSN